MESPPNRAGGMNAIACASRVSDLLAPIIIFMEILSELWLFAFNAFSLSGFGAS
jgi:hypothetical protein